MPVIVVNEEMWPKLLAAYRRHGKNYAAVQRDCDVGWITAERAWNRGWPRRGFAPIKEIFAEEERHARAEIQRRDELEKELQQKDAWEQRISEARSCRLARQTAVTLQAEAAVLVGAGRRLAEFVKTTVDAQLAAGEMTLPKAQQTLAAIVRFARDVNDFAGVTQTLERQRVGDPEHVIAMQVDDMSLDEAAERVKHAASLIALARSRAALPAGNLQVVEVQSSPPTEQH